jgi:hypothetical protein
MIAQQCLMDRPTDRADASGILVQLEEMKQEAPSGGGGGGGRARSQQQRHTAPEVRERSLFPTFDVKKRSLYQARLQTNIIKLKKKPNRFLAGPTLAELSSGPCARRLRGRSAQL